MITLITGCSGTGKTLAALNFAQEPETLFCAGEESPHVLQAMAFNHRLDVSKTRFLLRPPMLDLHAILATIELEQKSTSFTRLVIDDAQDVRMDVRQTSFLLDLANKYGLHILVTWHTRRVSKDREKTPPKDLLLHSASCHIHLDPEFDIRPRGILEKGRTPTPRHKLKEMFGVELH